jgi:hypothetical protein
MPESHPITIPLLNPNEPGALLAALHVDPGQHVKIGDQLCTLETTKSTVELTAESEGFVVGLTARPGQTVMAGDVLCYLAASPDWSPPVPKDTSNSNAVPFPKGIRISQPALLLAQQYKLDLSQLGGDRFITKKMIEDLIDLSGKPAATLSDQAYDPNAIIVYGAGGHGKALIDLIRVNGKYPIAGIVDDNPFADRTILGVPVLGRSNILELLVDRGVHLAVNAVGGIGNIDSRIKVFERLLLARFTCPALVHPTA